MGDWDDGGGEINERIDGGQGIGVGIDAEGVECKTGIGDESQGVGRIFGDGCRHG